MCVNVDVLRSIQIAITWQPIPAVARLPSGTLVDVLCGQPEQKYGWRCRLIFGRASAFSFASTTAMRAAMRQRGRDQAIGGTFVNGDVAS